jgi:hypothetical protein
LQVDDLPQLLPEQRDLMETVPNHVSLFRHPRCGRNDGETARLCRRLASHLPQLGCHWRRED